MPLTLPEVTQGSLLPALLFLALFSSLIRQINSSLATRLCRINFDGTGDWSTQISLPEGVGRPTPPTRLNSRKALKGRRLAPVW